MVSIESGLPVYDPGKLNQKIEIQAQATGRDTLGNKTGDWAAVRSVRASIELLGQQGPREFYQGGQISAESTHVIIVRYHPMNLNATMRAVARNQTFKIQSVDNVMMQNTWIQLFCAAFNEESNPNPKA